MRKQQNFKTYIFLLIIFLSKSSFSQIGGLQSFASVNIEMSPRSESMGGGVISILDNDIGLGQIAPSLLNKKGDNNLVFSYVNYFADISLLGFAYAKEFSKIGTVSLGIRSINYGEFDYNNEYGNNLGKFYATDQIITLGGSKKLNNTLIFGTNFNLFNSQYERYKSFAIYSNLSITYHKSSFTSTLLFKNLGRQLSSYTDVKEDLPVNVQFSLSKELKYLPFKYIISFHTLNKFNISSPYKLNSQTNFQTGEVEIAQETVAKNILRHIIIGGELNPFKKNLFIRAGCNLQRRFDMTLTTAPSLVGFSWGLGFSYSKFILNYSRSSYHLSGNLNNFSIATNINKYNL